MNISELSIKRPVMATVFTIIIILFGIIGYTYLGVREYPSVDNPIISVTCSYSGANADVIEISEDDYGLFYMDIIEDPEKYRGKTVQFKGRIMLSNQSNEVYVIGRNAMVCCAEDVRLIGLFVHSKNAEQMVDGDWIILKAKVGVMLDDDYQNKVPLLSELEYKRCRPMEDELVYFS